MTLILKLDPDIVKMYHHTKNEVSMLIASKVIARTHTDTTKTLPHSAGGKYLSKDIPVLFEVNLLSNLVS